MQIEPTDHCNLRCQMCTPHAKQWPQIHGISKGYLKVDTWRQITEDFHRHHIEFDHIIFQWLGDPSLHPQLPELVEIAVRNIGSQVNYLRIDTNAIRFDRSALDALCAISVESSVPLLLVFTLDACTEEVYHVVKGGPHYQRALTNIRYLIRRRKQLGTSAKLNIQLQFVVQEANAHQTIDFLNYWADLLGCQGGMWHDEIMFKRLSVDGGDVGQAAADALYHSNVIEKGIVAGAYRSVHVSVWNERPWQRDDHHQTHRTACPGLWMTPVIRHDGVLLMCCADLQSELALGDLTDSTFVELWHGPKAEQLRKAHLEGRFEGVCATCGGINWYKLSEAVLERYAQAQIDA
ncbi:MAG: radical SAM/SPASM domain-containing protein [Myxococcota bacterium]